MTIAAKTEEEKARLTLSLSRFPSDFEIDIDAPVPSIIIKDEKIERTGITIFTAVKAFAPINQLTTKASVVVTRWPDMAIITDPLR